MEAGEFSSRNAPDQMTLIMKSENQIQTFNSPPCLQILELEIGRKTENSKISQLLMPPGAIS